MDECNSHCMYPNLSANMSNDQQFRLNKRNEIKDYFIAEIRERELMRKNLSKYIASSMFISSKWQHSYCIIWNCYWSVCWNYEC